VARIATRLPFSLSVAIQPPSLADDSLGCERGGDARKWWAVGRG
jgi:hypothetical protein